MNDVQDKFLGGKRAQPDARNSTVIAAESHTKDFLGN